MAEKLKKPRLPGDSGYELEEARKQDAVASHYQARAKEAIRSGNVQVAKDSSIAALEGRQISERRRRKAAAILRNPVRGRR